MALYIGIKNLIGKGAAWLRSKWTTVVTQLLATFRYRVAAGGDNVNLPGSNGRAVFKKIYGNTVKWNQLLQGGDFSNGTTGWYIVGGTATAANNELTFTVISGVTNSARLEKRGLHFISGHSYYIHEDVFSSVGTTFRCGVATSTSLFGTLEVTRNTWNSFSSIGKLTAADADKLYLYNNQSGVLAEGDVIKYKNVYYSDLTDIFGSDAEIAAALGIDVADITTATGVAAFENWLALNPGYQDYYPYDAGSLVSFKGQGVKVTGWNKFHVVNGSGVADVKKGVKYYVAGPFGSLHYSDGTAISVASDRTFTAIKDDTITFGSVSNSIVLNIYTGTAKDGTYEPYWENVLPIDSTKIYGKVNGQGSYVQCYPNGMLSAGSVQDTLSASEAVVKVGSVDLGSLSWRGVDYYYAPLNGRKNYGQGICPKYSIITTTGDPRTTLNDKQMVFNNYATNSAVNFKDSDITSSDIVNNHIAKLEGVMLNYEIVTPITYTDLIYSEDGGVTGSSLTAFKYKVDKYSTEELLVPASVAGEPTSTAIVADIEYQAR